MLSFDHQTDNPSGKKKSSKSQKKQDSRYRSSKSSSSSSKNRYQYEQDPVFSRYSSNTEATACDSMGPYTSDEFSSNNNNNNNATATKAIAVGNSSANPNCTDGFPTKDKEIVYFGYGPIVNPLVRYRRGISTPPHEIETAILYDHRLLFVEGGTANIVPARGWDVKGVLLKFRNSAEWDAFRQFDANYDIQEVSVSVMNQKNPDPKHKNSKTFPSSDTEEEEDSDSGNDQQQQVEGEGEGEEGENNDNNNNDDDDDDNATGADDTEEEEDSDSGNDQQQQVEGEGEGEEGENNDNNDDDDDDNATGADDVAVAVADNDDGDDDECSSLIRTSRAHKSCPTNAMTSFMAEDFPDDNSEGSEDDYSCPFGLGGEAKDRKDAGDIVNCVTFAIDQPRSALFRRVPEDSVLCRPQERYLKLMTEGLRIHCVDETYVRDEILTVSYVPGERDRVVGSKAYKTFPVLSKAGGKLPKISVGKYENKLCSNNSSNNNNNKHGATKSDPTYFVCHNKVIRVDNPLEGSSSSATNNNNACLNWLRAVGHGKGDLTLRVHQTFVDPECLHVPLIDAAEDLTSAHYEWAEHTLVLYLERGGLTGSVVYELTDKEDKAFTAFSHSLGKTMTSVGRRLHLGGSGRDERPTTTRMESGRRRSVPSINPDSVPCTVQPFTSERFTSEMTDDDAIIEEPGATTEQAKAQQRRRLFGLRIKNLRNKSANAPGA
eukprot:CAMPEP_0172407882 /NCGR_PEP_ID=MMETSP1061-20121228/75563_1 /TAXON_ID=37318 /ORGANISM="Pseudo-nitzschia pungens, Strain cf. pungens" /LENGTH=715 /DNA_ID=CAMNT_0013143993 /DNA_START=564 /DNA_END=2711 /DNA_ORIENTATION=-